LEEAEPAHDGPGRVDAKRITASATYRRRLAEPSSLWASTIAWGHNSEAGSGSGFLLAETSVALQDRDAWFGGFEAGGKAAHDLDVHGPDETFIVAKLQGGYVRYFAAWNSLKPGIGGSLSASVVPNALRAVYGGRATLGFGVFVTLRPAAMMMSGTDPHAGHREP
jgi:hypothetical protein